MKTFYNQGSCGQFRSAVDWFGFPVCAQFACSKLLPRSQRRSFSFKFKTLNDWHVFFLVNSWEAIVGFLFFYTPSFPIPPPGNKISVLLWVMAPGPCVQKHLYVGVTHGPSEAFGGFYSPHFFKFLILGNWIFSLSPFSGWTCLVMGRKLKTKTVWRTRAPDIISLWAVNEEWLFSEAGLEIPW